MISSFGSGFVGGSDFGFLFVRFGGGDDSSYYERKKETFGKFFVDIKIYFVYRFVLLVRDASIILNRRRKHLSIGVRPTSVSHIRIHHPIVMVRMRRRMLLLNCRKGKKKVFKRSIKLYDILLTEYQ